MKRHEGIVALSRDHHFGLLFCWKIKQGLKKGVSVERMRPYVAYFWDKHLRMHFEEEEQLLFPLLQDHSAAQAVSEHAQIRQIVDELLHTVPLQQEQFHLLANALDRHIRFEERLLFPHIEKELPEEQLMEVGRKLQELHTTQGKDNYPETFWL